MPDGRKISCGRLCFRVDYDVWMKAEFEPSQKVEVFFDKDKMLGMIQPSDNGYATTPHLRRGCNDFDLTFLIPHDDSTGFPFFEHQTGMEEIEVRDGCIYFRVVAPGPTEFKSLGKNHQGNGEFQHRQKKPKPREHDHA